MKTDLKVQTLKRDPTQEKVNILRQRNFVPAVLYGNKIDTIHLSISEKQAEQIKKEGGKSTIFKLTIGEEPKERNVIIKELQNDKLKDKIKHIDFYEVDMNKSIETEIPLVFEGTSKAVKDLGGILVKNTNELSIRCLPKDLPEEIIVDISVLGDLEDLIKVENLQIPSGVQVLNKAEEIIAIVSRPRSEKEMEELDTEVESDVSKVEGLEDKEEEQKALAGEKGEQSGEEKNKEKESNKEKDKKE